MFLSANKQEVFQVAIPRFHMVCPPFREPNLRMVTDFTEIRSVSLLMSHVIIICAGVCSTNPHPLPSPQTTIIVTMTTTSLMETMAMTMTPMVMSEESTWQRLRELGVHGASDLRL